MSIGSTVPRVSVVVIFHNEERFLPDAIESVLAQDLDDWELLLCDDGSTDASGQLAGAWAASDSRVRVLHHPGQANLGMSATRNLGLGSARGDYVTFLDADDVWLRDRLSHHATLLDQHPDVAMVCGATEYWHSWAQTGESDDDVVLVGVEPGIATPPSLVVDLHPLGPGAAPCMCDVTVRREAALDVGGFEAEFTGLLEDQAFLVKMYLRHRVLVITEAFGRYRQHAESCMAVTGRIEAHRAWRAYFDWLEHHLDVASVDSPAVTAALSSTRQQHRTASVIARGARHTVTRSVARLRALR